MKYSSWLLLMIVNRSNIFLHKIKKSIKISWSKHSTYWNSSNQFLNSPVNVETYQANFHGFGFKLNAKTIVKPSNTVKLMEWILLYWYQKALILQTFILWQHFVITSVQSHKCHLCGTCCSLKKEFYYPEENQNNRQSEANRKWSMTYLSGKSCGEPGRRPIRNGKEFAYRSVFFTVKVGIHSAIK